MANPAPLREVIPLAMPKPYLVLCDTNDEKEWLAARNDGIGASEIGAIIGMDHRSSPLKLFLEKTGQVEPDDLGEIEAIRWGHRLEAIIAEAFAEETGRPVIRGRERRYSVMRSKDHPWALASLDFWTGEGNELWPLEIKNVNAFRAEDWVDGTPDYYLAQLHQQMLVTGSQRGTSACLLGGNKLLWCDVDRDETLIRKITFHGSMFWERLQQRTPPDPDGSDATTAVLKKLYPQDDGSTVELPMALAEIVDEWRLVKGQIKTLEGAETLLANQIKATMGEAQSGIFPSGDRVSWKTQQVKEHVVKAGTKRPLLYHPSKASKGR
jgi:putative phage-type endonuclease